MRPLEPHRQPPPQETGGEHTLLQRGRQRPQIRTDAVALAAALAAALVLVSTTLFAATPHFSLAGAPALDPVAFQDPSPGFASPRPASGPAEMLAQLEGRAVRPASSDPNVQARYEMVDQIKKRGLKDRRVLEAMARVPRHLFVPEVLREEAHLDKALPIGHGQNIYQPYLVAYMTSLLDLQPDDRVLEIGTGSGYHTAVLAQLAGRVYSIEIIEALGKRAEDVLRGLGYRNIELRIGDGYKGWEEAAPFDAILLTAAPPEIPQALIDQLAMGGTMVAPVGGGPVQELQVIVKAPEGLEKQYKGPYVVPLMTRNGERGTERQP